VDGTLETGSSAAMPRSQALCREIISAFRVGADPSLHRITWNRLYEYGLPLNVRAGRHLPPRAPALVESALRA